ncbi:hypothetical protein G7Z17_g213 [Cylindrodendrum hubeiense]|uniref:Uncharacterized protein n=1 Tax=Cylindrodendrum hubeiense TaxID=595255 RepID=A0A9P5HSF1_9HYPO|nr:hypothetical protein G7Z17_g213 [Cylindrodendrum hubeiense]
MAHASITPQQQAAISEYLSQNKRVDVSITILGVERSGRHSLIQQLAHGKIDTWNDPFDNGETLKLIRIEDTPIMIQFRMYLGSAEPVDSFEFIKAMYVAIRESGLNDKPVWPRLEKG